MEKTPKLNRRVLLPSSNTAELTLSKSDAVLADKHPQNGVVLVHGAWHSRATYNEVLPFLKAAEVPAIAIDLPGAGANNHISESFKQKSRDPEAFATEPSPNADVTQDQRTEAVIAAVRKMNAETGGKAVLLGHSLGGLTITPVAEAIPDEISAVVYLTAFMLPPRMVAGQMIDAPSMSDQAVTGLLKADPAVVGALRMDVASNDPEYLANVRTTFYGDVSDEQFRAIVATLHPDEPAKVFAVPSVATRQRFGNIARYFITCTQDNAIPYTGQLEMIRLMDQAMENETTVLKLETSHSPFLSSPKGLAQIISDILSS